MLGFWLVLGSRGAVTVFLGLAMSVTMTVAFLFLRVRIFMESSCAFPGMLVAGSGGKNKDGGGKKDGNGFHERGVQPI